MPLLGDSNELGCLELCFELPKSKKIEFKFSFLHGGLPLLLDIGLHSLLDSGLPLLLDSDSPRGGLIKSLHSGLPGLPRSGLFNPPLSGLIIKPDSGLVSSDNMANKNVPAPAPMRSDDQILPFNAWVPIGKSNYVLDLQKKQRNPIFQIFVDILQNINFFRAFTTSASVPAIYIQQFWNTLTQEAKTRVYHFQLDEDWFILNANLLREALDITPIDQAHQFESPPLVDAIMDFVNTLGYPEEIHFVSRMAVNNLYQPWRAILSMINQCLTGKTSGFDRPGYLIFLADKANLGIATKKDKKIKPHVIPYYRFTKLIICYLGRKHNINQRSGSPFNMAEDDLCLGNLKFVPKGKEDEVFGMQIPKELITDNIRNAPYYNAYMEMVAKQDHKIAAEEGGKKKSASKADQSKKPATAKQPKPVSSKQSKPALLNSRSLSLHLVDEKEQAQPKPEPEHQGEEVDYDLQRGIQMSLESFQPPVGGVAFREPASGAETDKRNSEGDTEILNIEEEQGEDVANQVDLEEKTAEVDEGQARSDPGKTPESRPPSKHVLMEEDQSGPNCDNRDLSMLKWFLYVLNIILRYEYIKNHKKTVKNGQARTRESEEYKKKPKIQSRSQKCQALVISMDYFSSLTLKSHVSYGESTQVMGFCANLLTKEAQHVTSKNDMLAILYHTQMIKRLSFNLPELRINGDDDYGLRIQAG
ncbi:hypothetical protein Tco_0926898 [Tanacetum coccineum]|uniref:Uncharacterized protein n=1 Tax=Tanacetum coccineum TaxID=301880 RepID=A0ABQ5DHD1_9ASTR